MRVVVTLLLFLVICASVALSQTVSGRSQLSGKTVHGNSDAVVIVIANLAKGTGTDGISDKPRQVTDLTSGTNADILLVQERNTGDAGWDASLTSAGFAQQVYLENAPQQGDGPAIWTKTSRVTTHATFSHALSVGFAGNCDSGWDVDKAAVAADVTVAGRRFYVVSTHLCWSACNDVCGNPKSSQRVSQINELLSWIGLTLTSAQPIFIGGDMNFPPDATKDPSGFQLDLFTANYTDLWQAGISAGTALANWDDRDSNFQADMPVGVLGTGSQTGTTRTHDTRRIDYGFLKTGVAGLSLQSMETLDTRAACTTLGGAPLRCINPNVIQTWSVPDDYGVRPSDHNWIKVVLNVQ